MENWLEQELQRESPGVYPPTFCDWRVSVEVMAISAEAVSAEAETPTSGAIGRCLTCEDEGVLGW